MATHLAAVASAKGQPLELRARPTPKPGPGELLIAVKSVALNPADTFMRGQGLFIQTYPTVFGFDVAGLVLEVGDAVPTQATDDDSAPFFQPGVSRIAAFAASFWRSYDPDYGAFQERCLVPWQHALLLPDNGMSWNHAATLSVSIEVPLNAWDLLGVPRIGAAGASALTNRGNQTDSVQKSEIILIWGAASSVGTMGVQTARLLREDPSTSFAAVYAVAGSGNHSYVSSLGADRVFDYKDSQVVENIIDAVKEDGLEIRRCFLAMGELALCQAVLKPFVGAGPEGNKATPSKIASAPVVPEDAEVIDGMETVFVFPSSREEERLEQMRYWLGTFGRANLAKGTIKPSPEPRIVGKGLGAINAGLDELVQGVSCTKLVVEIAE
ncbi:hypothetical protein S40288_04225 [Stachybotrys chartarum IBT 40288]|nr:hypothetical protein S40288_04225 [Stachybotrys chartarum IBT 40288]